MNFKQVNEEELRTIYPNGELKNMCDKDKQNFLQKYFLYRKLFTEFLILKLELREYDEEIANSKLNFKPSNEDDMDFYQYFSSEELKYFYIRNNIYIDKLSQIEDNFLQKRIDNNNYDFDIDAKKFIEDTYEKVIFEDVLNNGDTCITIYGPDSSSFMAPNNAVVIGFRYDEFNLNGLDDNNWNELHNKQLLYLRDLDNKMSVNMDSALQVPVAILKYNEFSIKKRV